MTQGFLIKLNSFLAQQQFLTLFLIVAAGCLLGRVKIKGFGLGTTASTIVLGLLVSAIAYLTGVKIAYPDLLSNVFFYLFIFAVGLRIGPQFWFGIKQAGLKFVALGLIGAALGPVLAFAWGRLFHLSDGMTVGLLGGATTNTPTLGGAQSALASGVAKLQGASSENVSGDLSTTFAITYVFGMASFLLFQKLVPKIFKKDLQGAAQEVDKQTAGGPPAPGTPEALTPAYVPAEVRAYRVENEALLGEPLSTLRQKYPRGAILKVQRDGKLLAPTDDLVLRRGDEIAVVGRIEVLVERAREIGPELTQHALRSIPTETVEVVITRRDLVGKTLEQLVRGVGHGLYLDGLFRAGDQVPATAETIVRKGDVLRVTGDAAHIATLAKAAGGISRTDVYALKLNPAILLGAMAGARTNSPGMRVAQEDAHSTAPAIGFPVPFAIGTILLTIAGYVLMAV
jgi:putative transport protein